MAEKLCFNDLSSIVSMIKREKAKFNLPLYINIESATRVSVFTSMDNHKDREMPYVAHCSDCRFNFGREYSYEDFIIALRSQFVQNEDTANLLTVLKKSLIAILLKQKTTVLLKNYCTTRCNIKQCCQSSSYKQIISI